VSVDVANASSKKAVLLNEVENLRVCGNGHLRQVRKRLKDNLALAKIAESDFANNEGMREHERLIEQLRQRLIALAQMIYPN
jgi:hypothetical protein